MPKIKVDHVVSFSSEDPCFPANNLLDPDPAKKWKCKNNGEKQAFVILQLEKASVISSIDIGNEHSAYVEVLVTRSDGSKDSDFKVLLVMSSFMTPLESRQSSNVNKVRMFKSEELSSPEREEKWDRIKIVCTQPFNRHVQYGLSFITLHFLENKNAHTPVQQTIGKFALRPPSPNDIAVGSTFLKKKETAEYKPSAAAAIRDATTSSPSFKPKLFNTNKNQQTPESVTKKARNRDDLLYSTDEEKPNEKIDKIMEEKKKESEEKREKEEQMKQKKEKEKRKEKEEEASRKKQKKQETVKRRSENENNTPRKKAKQKVTKPFNGLLNGVTIVISGIQNPDRADLRTKALEMGAKYKPDWDDNTCTHLICAFANTPKFNQVKGKGKIVTRKWIENCHSQRKRLPWRRFALDKSDLGQPESEDEILEEIATESEVIEDDDDVVESVNLDGSDTEDEIERIQTLQQIKQNENGDEVGDLLENFFENKTFHVDRVINYKDRALINRYIIAYSGNITKEPKEADLIVTNEDNVDLVKSICGTETVCVTANWVFECHNAKKLIAFDDFKL